MAAAPSAAASPLSKEAIIEMHAQLEQLRVTMAERQAGGRETSGRYKRHDTARRIFINVVAMPSLRLG